MKVKDKLKDKFLVMYVDRELELQRLKGEPADIKKAVHTAVLNTLLTVECLVKLAEGEIVAATPKSPMDDSA